MLHTVSNFGMNASADAIVPPASKRAGRVGNVVNLTIPAEQDRRDKICDGI